MRKSRIKRLKRFLNPMALALILTVLVYVIVRVAPSDKFDTVDEYLYLTGAFATYLALGLLFNKANNPWSPTRPVIVPTTEELEVSLQDLSRILGDAGRSLKSIEMQISARESAARKLAARTEQLRSTAEMYKEDAQRVGVFLTQQLEKRLKEMNRASRKTSRRAFILGALVSVPIGIVIEMLMK